MNLKTILKMTQPQLKKALAKELGCLGYEPVNKKGFLYAEGTIPVLLTAHMDTVHKEPVREICISEDGDIWMSPQGIGGDDRCGVHMILDIIQSSHCSVLFCEDEEIGSVGAREFIKSGFIPKVNYIIELDRHGDNDAVFYDCANDDFEEFVTSFGTKTNIGSFSDISVIAPALGVAAVNLSCGYHNEHNRYETISISQMNRIIGVVREMLATETKPFEYVEYIRPFKPVLYSNEKYFEDEMDFDMEEEGIWLNWIGETGYVMINGELEDGAEYYVDENSNVFRYAEYGFTLQPNAEAFGESGLPYPFDPYSAEWFDIFEFNEAAIDILEEAVK